MKLGETIRVAREWRWINQSALATMAGVTPAHISLIEAGRRTPSLELLREIADALDLPLHTLIYIAQEAQDQHEVVGLLEEEA